MNVVVLLRTYLPGYRAGGPILSVADILDIEATSDFLVVASNRDIGTDGPYEGLEGGGTRVVRGRKVLYVRSLLRDLAQVRSAAREAKPNFYYLNSLHDVGYSWLPILAVRLRFLPRAPFLLAPHGECALAALAVSPWKKRIARRLLPVLLPQTLIWHVTKEAEVDEVRNWLSNSRARAAVFVVASVPAPQPVDSASDGSGERVPRIVFLSRIHPIKGLLEGIKAFTNVLSECTFTIHGVIEDEAYWERCLIALGALPPNIHWNYAGGYLPSESSSILASGDALLLPTKSESFCRVIAEALSVGCPVLVPDTTPWTPVIEEGAGIVLWDSDSITAALEGLGHLGVEERAKWRTGALAAYARWHENHRRDFSPFARLAPGVNQ